MPKIDLTGVEVKTFEPLGIPRVVCEVKDIKNQVAKRSGAQKVQIISKVLTDTEGNEIPGNRQVFFEVSLQPDARWNVKRTLIALGDDPDDLEGEIDFGEENKEDYVGRQHIAVLYLDSSPEALGTTGVPKEKVSRFEPLPEAML